MLINMCFSKLEYFYKCECDCDVLVVVHSVFLGTEERVCGHIIAVFDYLQKCARYWEKGLGSVPCVLGEDCPV